MWCTGSHFHTERWKGGREGLTAKALVVPRAFTRQGSSPQEPRKHGDEAKKTHLSSATCCPSSTRESWTTSRWSSEPMRRGEEARFSFKARVGLASLPQAASRKARKKLEIHGCIHGLSKLHCHARPGGFRLLSNRAD